MQKITDGLVREKSQEIERLLVKETVDDLMSGGFMTTVLDAFGATVSVSEDTTESIDIWFQPHKAVESIDINILINSNKT